MNKKLDSGNKYYKVVRAATRTSCSVESCELILVYKPNQWTKPKIPNSKIFVFENENDAKEYISTNSWTSLSIIPCHVKNPSKTIKVRLMTSCNASEATHFWKNVNEIPGRNWPSYWTIILDGKRTDIKTLPYGTVICDEVYCLE